MTLTYDVENKINKLRENAGRQRALSTADKNKVLRDLAVRITQNSANLLAANQKDLTALAPDTAAAFRDRLTLSTVRVQGLVETLRQVAELPDPVGEVIDEKVLPNGLKLKRIRAPLGIIFMIFESRPNVIIEAFSLAFKSGNSIVLRGGSEARHTNQALYALISQALGDANLKEAAYYGVENYDRQLVEALLLRKDLIDVVVPRGGDKLIDFVQRTARMPIIKNDRGLCHTYVSEDADLEMAVRIVTNAKTHRPGVCNSLETVLVHRNVAAQFLPRLYEATAHVNLAWRVDAASRALLGGRTRVELATDEAWDTEYLDFIMNCRVVDSLDMAMAHIQRHGSKHSEAIVTSSAALAQRFQNEVDAAAVYWNASTRFTDGYEFGLGGELGISTQKLHVRGPVGLRELSTPRWIIEGTGQIRS